MNWLYQCDCLITGAASGLGRALAIELARDYHCRITAIDRNTEGLKSLLEELSREENQNHRIYTMDVSSKEEWEKIVRVLKKEQFFPDILINNAGIIQPFSQSEHWEKENVNRIIEVNLYGTLHGVRATLPLLKKSSKACILNIASSAAFLAIPGRSLYAAAKTAIRGFTEALSAELFGEEVKVILVHPGAVYTAPACFRESRKNGMTSPGFGKLGLSATRAAHILVKGLKRRKSRILIGADSQWMDGFFRWMPGKIVTILGRSMRKGNNPLYQRMLEGEPRK